MTDRIQEQAAEAPAHRTPGCAWCRSVIAGAAITLLSLMTGCDGYGDRPGPPREFPCTGGGIAIQAPSASGLFTTAATTISLSGIVNANYPNVVWSDPANGSSGTASIFNYRCGPLYLLPIEVCLYDWRSDVPLAKGDNLIKADAYDLSGVLNARDCITITQTGP